MAIGDPIGDPIGREFPMTSPPLTTPMASAQSLWVVLPFAGLLLSIALIPGLAPRFWLRRMGWVAAAWSLS